MGIIRNTEKTIAYKYNAGEIELAVATHHRGAGRRNRGMPGHPAR